MDISRNLPLFLRRDREYWAFLCIRRKIIRRFHLGSLFSFLILIAVIGLVLNVRFIISFMKDDSESKISEKMDWHDWKLIEKEKLRRGLGEHGKAAYIWPYPHSSSEINETHGYNGYLSDNIALDRSLVDFRPAQ